MPRFFFHVTDDEVFLDTEGTFLPDIDAARKEAAQFTATLLLDRPGAVWGADEWTMRITDDTDLTLFTLTLQATDGPALANYRV